MIELHYPTKPYKVNQPFGANYNGFYKELGYKGHNGVDLYAPNRWIVRAAHEGEVIMVRTDRTGGKEINIVSKDGKYKTVYYHLKIFMVSVGQKVKAGDVLALADNTGKYTTGSHLHFSLKEVVKNEWGGYNTLNRDNGYNGAIDPEPYWSGAYAENIQTLIRKITEVAKQVQILSQKIHEYLANIAK